jgi:hypothetical protein
MSQQMLSPSMSVDIAVCADLVATISSFCLDKSKSYPNVKKNKNKTLELKILLTTTV